MKGHKAVYLPEDKQEAIKIERQKFEEWSKKAGFDLTYVEAGDGFYSDGATNFAWLGWQGAKGLI